MEEFWWSAAFKGEKEIDVQKIDASRPMSELDEEAQAKIAQMLFDQEQKRKGLPTTEEKVSDYLLFLSSTFILNLEVDKLVFVATCCF